MSRQNKTPKPQTQKPGTVDEYISLFYGEDKELHGVEVSYDVVNHQR